jgi:ParB family chromosome partitioning protein
MRLQYVACAEIVPSPHGGYPPHEVEALAADIRAHGILRPLLLRQTAQGYVIVHGERRWQAARLVGLQRVPACLVQDFPWTDLAFARQADGAALDA